MYKNFLIIISFIFITSCGYTINNKLNDNYNIISFNSSGDSRINYKIKNKLMFNNNPGSQKLFILDVNTKKQRNIKDKNIKNEITSYDLIITASISYEIVGKNQKERFIISEAGDYKVSSSRLDTLNNEKSLINTLTANMIDKIKFQLRSIAYDN